jgi:methyl-accepting chemotaxis protein
MSGIIVAASYVGALASMFGMMAEAANGVEPGLAEKGALLAVALAFITLFWRADKRAERYARGLDKRDEKIEEMASAACEIREIAEKSARSGEQVAEAINRLAAAIERRNDKGR